MKKEKEDWFSTSSFKPRKQQKKKRRQTTKKRACILIENFLSATINIIYLLLIIWSFTNEWYLSNHHSPHLDQSHHCHFEFRCTEIEIRKRIFTTSSYNIQAHWSRAERSGLKAGSYPRRQHQRGEPLFSGCWELGKFIQGVDRTSTQPCHHESK